MKNIRLILFIAVFAVVAAVAYAVIYFAQTQPSPPGQYDKLTKCLTANGAIMYGQTNCHACLYQMQLLGTSFSYINETNCTDDYDYCSSLSIGATPTWMINGSYYVGIQTPEQLANESGCAI